MDDFTLTPYHFENQGRGPHVYDVDDVPGEDMADYSTTWPGTQDREPPTLRDLACLEENRLKSWQRRALRRAANAVLHKAFSRVA